VTAAPVSGPGGVAPGLQASSHGLRRHVPTEPPILGHDEGHLGASPAVQAAHRARGAAPGTRSSARLRRNRADRRGARGRARGPWPRCDAVRQRRLHGRRQPTGADRPPSASAGRPGSRPLGRLSRRDRNERAAPGRRVRRDPLTPRVGEPAHGPGDARPSRRDLPRPAGPAVCGRRLQRPAAGPRRDQPVAGGGAPESALGRRRPQRPGPDRGAVRRTFRRGSLLRGPDRAGEGHR
jgi:hypothetical protein